jgi:hypothetical protein
MSYEKMINVQHVLTGLIKFIVFEGYTFINFR